MICLELLSIKMKNEDNDEEENYLSEIEKIGNKIINLIKKIKDNKNKKYYMITPCNHTFHSVCLEKWLEQKTYAK